MDSFNKNNLSFNLPNIHYSKTKSFIMTIGKGRYFGKIFRLDESNQYQHFSHINTKITS